MIWLIILYLSVPPSLPNITSLNSLYADQLAVNWTLVRDAASYNISINGSAPVVLPANATTYLFTELSSDSFYTISLVAINCAGSSSPAVKTGKTSTYKGNNI